MTMHMILMAGLPGTGKSTTGEILKNKLKGFVMHNLITIKRDMGHKIFRPKQKNAVRVELYMRAKKSLMDGENVILDNTFSIFDMDENLGRDGAYDIATMYGADILIIEVFCSHKTAKKRMKNRPISKGIVGDARNPKVHDKILKRWEDIQQDLDDGKGDNVSYIRYDTEKNGIIEVNVHPGSKPFVSKIKKILLVN